MLIFTHNIAQNFDEAMQFAKYSPGDTSAEAGVTTRVKIRGAEHEVLEDASDSGTTDDLPCVSTIHAGIVGCKIADDGSQIDLAINGQWN